MASSWRCFRSTSTLNNFKGCKRRRMNGEEDIISDLPREIIECIVAVLPVHDAARTSILSRKWRYIWTTHPQLIFDNHSNIVATPSPLMTLVNTINKVILLHSGPTIEAIKLIGFPDMKPVSLENCQNLNIVSIAPFLNGTTNLFELLANSPRLARVTMDSFILKVLAAGAVPHRLPPINNLRSIHLHRIDFNDLTQIGHIIWLLYTFNNLVELEIEGVGCTSTVNHSDSDFWEKLPSIHEEVERLQKVKLVLFCPSGQCSSTKLSFIKYLLSRCQNLERMIVQFKNLETVIEEHRIKVKLLTFQRASCKARIQWVEENDTSI